MNINNEVRNQHKMRKMFISSAEKVFEQKIKLKSRMKKEFKECRSITVRCCIWHRTRIISRLLLLVRFEKAISGQHTTRKFMAQFEAHFSNVRTVAEHSTSVRGQSFKSLRFNVITRFWKHNSVGRGTAYWLCIHKRTKAETTPPFLTKTWAGELNFDLYSFRQRTDVECNYPQTDTTRKANIDSFLANWL